MGFFGITPVKNKEWRSFWLIVVACVLLVGVSLYDFIMYKGMHTSLWLFVIGVLLIVFGLVLRLVCSLTLGKYFSLHVEIAPDHKLVKKGLYKTVRHPMYTGGLLMGLGVPAVFGSLFGLGVFLWQKSR